MMLTHEKPSQADELDSFIARFESAHVRGPNVNLAEFLPDSDHPLYDEVLRELARIDLECTWTAGRPKQLDDYARQFPEFFQNLENLQVVAFEEYRLRLQHGDEVRTEEYQRRFDIDTGNWPATRLESIRLPCERGTAAMQAVRVFGMFQAPTALGASTIPRARRQPRFLSCPTLVIASLAFGCSPNLDVAHLAGFSWQNRAIWPSGPSRSRFRASFAVNRKP